MARHRNTFETSRDCVIRSYRVYGKTVTAKLYEDDTRERRFHIYFNPSKQAAERQQLEQTIDRMKLFLDKQLGQPTTFGKLYHEYFDLHYNKKKELLTYEERADIIEQKLELCGYFCIITSEEMTASQALIHYKGRNFQKNCSVRISHSLVPGLSVYRRPDRCEQKFLLNSLPYGKKFDSKSIRSCKKCLMLLELMD